MDLLERVRSRSSSHQPHERLAIVVPLTIAVWFEDDAWLSECVELGIGSFGESPDEAAAQAMDAVCSYLNTLEELKERPRVFAEKSIATYFGDPADFTLAKMTRELAKRDRIQLRPFEYAVPALA